MSSALERAASLRRAGRLAEALPLYAQAVHENPLDAAVLRQAAAATAEAGDGRAAAALLEMGLRFAPDDADAWYALAVTRFDLREHDASAAALARVLALRPRSVGARVILGTIHYLEGRPAEGFAIHSDALAIDTDDPRHLTARALLRVSRGDWTRGWAEYETRWSPRVGYSLGRVGDVDLTARRWTGEPLPHGTVCVHPEAGLGDTLLFARYLPRVAARVGRVVLADAQPEVRRLLEPMPGLAGFMARADQAATDVRHVSIFSLPHVFGDTEATVPRDVPYVRAPPDGPRLAPRTAGTRLRVGLVWAGKPSQHLDHDRSVPRLELLAPALRVAGVEWVSLQLGPRASEAAASGLTPAPTLRDLADTAFLLTQLDVVLTIDSSVANLAGALGLPLWVLAQTHPEIRWPVHRADSPWFPTARVFRRERSDDWPGVAARVAAALEDRLGGAP